MIAIVLYLVFKLLELVKECCDDREIDNGNGKNARSTKYKNKGNINLNIMYMINYVLGFKDYYFCVYLHMCVRK